MNPLNVKYHLTPLNCTQEQFRVFATQLQLPQSLDISMFVNQRPEPSVDGNGIGHVYISGFLGSGLTPFEKMLGATDYDDIVKEVFEIAQFSKQVILHIKSGGGSAAGNTETAKALAGIRNLNTWNSGVMASAAYNIGVMGRFVGSSESAISGSIGTIIPFVDTSGQWEMFGMKFDPITNEEGDLKGIGHAPSLSDRHRSELQKQVQTHFNMFKNNVLSQRIIESDTMRGQVFLGEESKERNLIDFVGTYSDFYNQITTRK